MNTIHRNILTFVLMLMLTACGVQYSDGSSNSARAALSDSDASLDSNPTTLILASIDRIVSSIANLRDAIDDKGRAILQPVQEKGAWLVTKAKEITQNKNSRFSTESGLLSQEESSFEPELKIKQTQIEGVNLKTQVALLSELDKALKTLDQAAFETQEAALEVGLK